MRFEDIAAFAHLTNDFTGRPTADQRQQPQTGYPIYAIQLAMEQARTSISDHTRISMRDGIRASLRFYEQLHVLQKQRLSIVTQPCSRPSTNTRV